MFPSYFLVCRQFSTETHAAMLIRHQIVMVNVCSIRDLERLLKAFENRLVLINRPLGIDFKHFSMYIVFIAQAMKSKDYLPYVMIFSPFFESLCGFLATSREKDARYLSRQQKVAITLCNPLKKSTSFVKKDHETLLEPIKRWF